MPKPNLSTTAYRLFTAFYNFLQADRADTPEERRLELMEAIASMSVATNLRWDDELVSFLQSAFAVPDCRTKFESFLTFLFEPAHKQEPMQGIFRRRRRDFDTKFPNEAALRAAELTEGDVSQLSRDERQEFIECLRELRGFGDDEDYCQRAGLSLSFEDPAPATAPSLKTLLAFIEDGQADELKAKCAASEEDEDGYGFNLLFFLLLQVIAVYIRRWLDKILP